MSDLGNRVAIVTGSSSGVGAATAALLAERGCRVAVNCRSNVDGAEKTAEACGRAGSEALVVQADVARDEDCRRLVRAAVDRWGRVDILVNNAGVTKFVDHADLDGLDGEDFQRIYAVNVVGAWQMTRAAAGPMRERPDGGAVVNVASVAGVTGIGSCVAYAASKGAMVTMTLSLARALGPAIRVNAVCPGFIEGDWLRDGYGEERYRKLMDFNRENAPLGVTATAEEAARAVLVFVDGPRIVTGETLIVDGGRHLAMAPLTRR